MIIDGDVHISPHLGADRIGAEEALRRLDRAGVDRAICWLQPHYTIAEVEQSNAYIHRAMVRHPDRILGFGWANPHLGLDRAKDTIKRCLDEYGFYGIKLNGAQNGYYIDDPVLALPLIEELARAGKPLALHVGSDAFERTHPFRVAKIARQFPELQILLVHMGGAAVPDMSDAVIEFAQQCPNMHLIGSCVYATRVWKAIQALGPKRISYGSDTPFFFAHVEVAKYNAMLDGAILDGDLLPEDKHNIMAGNLIRVLDL
jgi:predicted TIM-barrel fold metal-dependent hydrolase